MYKFKCQNCFKIVEFNSSMGTKNRNHCPFCLFSLHVDKKESGDRLSGCKKLMEPIGLTFKNEGVDKYGINRQGELMLIHKCKNCQKISINRIAGDDNVETLMDIFLKSSNNKNLEKKMAYIDIKLLVAENAKRVRKQLYG